MKTTATNMELEFLCCKCLIKLKESEVYLFGGSWSFACEKCIREYYSASHYLDICNELRKPPDFFVNMELKERRYNAEKSLKLNRRTFQKQTTRLREHRFVMDEG